MSDVGKAVVYLENSILQGLLKRVDITDISFNGAAIFYQSSLYGRKKADLNLSYDQAYQLIKQLANLMNRPFTYLDAIVDMSIARYRIFAVGPSVSRKEYEPSLTFAIRIHPVEKQVAMKFLTDDGPWFHLFRFFIHHGVSIVIAGKTGSGKTQLQKELLMLMQEAKRVIILDNILELDGLNIPHLDISIWQIQSMFSIQTMVEGALRSHPDWLLIAESRGAEFKEVLRSVKTGHPIITTLHSDRLDHVYDRMVSMLLIEESLTHLEQLFTDVKRAFPVLIQLVTLETDTGLLRRIDQVSIMVQGQLRIFNANVNPAMIQEVMNAW